MPRSRRFEEPGRVYHITARGVNRERIFHDDRDRFHFLKSLVRACERGQFRVVAWVLMGNHVHLVVLRGELELGVGLGWLFGTYAQRFNLRHGRCGHLFQNRFNERLCDTDSYLVHLIRYVHANPVRAGLVEHEDEYRYSSQRWYADSRWPDWAAPEVTRAYFTTSRSRQRFFYRGDPAVDGREVETCLERLRQVRLQRVRPSVEAEDRDEARPAAASSGVKAVPDESFLLHLQTAIERQHLLAPGGLLRRRPAAEVTAGRREFTRFAVRSSGIPANRVARFLGLTPGRVSQYLRSPDRAEIKLPRKY